MHREYVKWHSPRLHRDMELLTFGHAGARVLVFPSRAGRFYEYENWGMVNQLREHLEKGWLQLFCVDSIDAEGLYCTGCGPEERIRRHVLYQEYVIEEVLPFTRLLNPDPFCIAHGCSLGAYQAVNIAFRYPQWFGKVVAFSGRYDLTCTSGPFRSLFDGYYDQSVYFNTPSHFIPNLADEGILRLLRRMEITLAIGKQDPFLDNNQELSSSLWSQGIWNALELWDGEAHRPRYWRQMVAHYL